MLTQLVETKFCKYKGCGSIFIKLQVTYLCVIVQCEQLSNRITLSNHVIGFVWWNQSQITWMILPFSITTKTQAILNHSIEVCNHAIIFHLSTISCIHPSYSHPTMQCILIFLHATTNFLLVSYLGLLILIHNSSYTMQILHWNLCIQGRLTGHC